MGENKQLRKRLQGLTDQILIHQEKIIEELRKPQPDQGLIRHWEKEVQTWQSKIQQLKKRLP